MTEEVPDFLDFRARFWGRESFWWHHDAWAAIQKYNRLIMLIPPGHTKTTTWSIEHSAWQIVKDRNHRILTIQKNADEASKVVGAVQERLSDLDYYRNQLGLPKGEDPITKWGPFKPETRGYRASTSWGSDHFRVVGFTSGEKDYSMEAKGMTSAVLSTRPDLIVMDDIQEAGDDGPAQTAKLLHRIQSAVLTRVYPEQKVIILGSRLGPTDIYSRLLNDEEFEDWPVVRYPAVLPRCDVCIAKKKACRHAERRRMLVPILKDFRGKTTWDYAGLVKRKKEVGTNVWWTSYMMEEGDHSIATFKKESIDACMNGDYELGVVPPQVTDVFIGCDPAIVEFCAIITWGLDRRNGQRYLIDIYNEKGLRTFGNIQRKLLEFVQKYGPRVLVIEQANVQESLTNDPVFEKAVRGYGCRLVTYATRTNTGARAEVDEYDISSIGDLFDSGLIVLPAFDDRSRKAVRGYTAQFLEWRPKPQGSKSWHLVRDMVMATLFAEAEAREYYIRSKNRKVGPRTTTSRVPSWAKDRLDRWKQDQKSRRGDSALDSGFILPT